MHDDLIGKPFKDHGRGPDYYDCWGLVREVFSRYGIKLPMYLISCYDVASISEQIKKEKELSFKGLNNWREIKEPEEPCLILIKNDPVYTNHCAVYVGSGYMLHTLESTGVIRTRLTNPLWKRRIRGFWKYVKQ